jgi:hypothetical protein
MFQYFFLTLFTVANENGFPILTVIKCVHLQFRKNSRGQGSSKFVSQRNNSRGLLFFIQHLFIIIILAMKFHFQSFLVVS